MGKDGMKVPSSEDELPASAHLPTRALMLGKTVIKKDWPIASAEEITQAGGAFTSGALFKVTWKLTAVTLLNAAYGKIDGDMFAPYLWSRVHCCDLEGNGGPMLDGKYNITDPDDLAAYNVDQKLVRSTKK